MDYFKENRENNASLNKFYNGLSCREVVFKNVHLLSPVKRLNQKLNILNEMATLNINQNS